MESSIQEIGRKINSQLSVYDCAALALTALTLCFLAYYLWVGQMREKLPTVYSTSFEEVKGVQTDARPFGSKNGTTYTFSWCSGSGQIKDVNKIYYESEGDALAHGRRLSKLCKK